MPGVRICSGLDRTRRGRLVVRRISQLEHPVQRSSDATSLGYLGQDSLFHLRVSQIGRQLPERLGSLPMGFGTAVDADL